MVDLHVSETANRLVYLAVFTLITAGITLVFSIRQDNFASYVIAMFGCAILATVLMSLVGRNARKPKPVVHE